VVTEMMSARIKRRYFLIPHVEDVDIPLGSDHEVNGIQEFPRPSPLSLSIRCRGMSVVPKRLYLIAPTVKHAKQAIAAQAHLGGRVNTERRSIVVPWRGFPERKGFQLQLDELATRAGLPCGIYLQIQRLFATAHRRVLSRFVLAIRAFACRGYPRQKNAKKGERKK